MDERTAIVDSLQKKSFEYMMQMEDLMIAGDCGIQSEQELRDKMQSLEQELIEANILMENAKYQLYIMNARLEDCKSQTVDGVVTLGSKKRSSCMIM